MIPEVISYLPLIVPKFWCSQIPWASELPRNHRPSDPVVQESGLLETRPSRSAKILVGPGRYNSRHGIRDDLTEKPFTTSSALASMRIVEFW